MFIPRVKNDSFNLMDSGLFGNIVKKDYKAIGFMSGYTMLDYPTAHTEYNGNDMAILPNGGFFPRIYTVFGVSETGKTTTLIQVGGSIVDSCWGSTLVFVDAEGNTTPERIKSLNNWSDSDYRKKCLYYPPSPHISIDDTYNLIRKIAHSKASKGDKIKVTTPYKDIYTGEFIKVYPPTVVIVDSVPSLVISNTAEEAIDGKKEYKDIEKVVNNIDGMRQAKEHTNFLNKVKGTLDEFNIILLLINHLTKEPPMSMFDKPKKHHPGFKAGEKLKCGDEQIYQSFGLIRISQKELIDDRNPVYGDDIRGYVNSLDHVKNKSNVSANEFKYVFDKLTGIRPELTDFECLYDKKIGVEGSPSAMFLTILPEIKFTRKSIISKCENNPILPRALSFMTKYVVGNECVVRNRFGTINLQEFAKMPYHVRVSIIYSMTTPYSCYNINTYGNGPIAEDLMIAARGNQHTNLGNGYVSPVNIDIINNIVNKTNAGYSIVEGSSYDPADHYVKGGAKILPFRK